MKNKAHVIILFLILTLATTLRFYGQYWDAGWHLHPDERMLIMVADRIHFFDNLDPDFFNYGSLPIYLLRGISQVIDPLTDRLVAGYDGLLIVGRTISAITDVLVVLLIYFISLLLFRRKQAALIGALIYSLAFFPVQNAHFFVVDVYLNFFSTLILLLCVYFIKKQKIWIVPLLGIACAGAITTKATGLILVLPALLTLTVRPLFPFQQKNIIKVIFSVFIFGAFFAGSAYIFMPYAFNQNITLSKLILNPSLQNLLNPKLLADVSLQMQMNSDPYIFPYTLQYVKTTPYIYYLKNIFLYGFGPIACVFALIGAAKILLIPLKDKKEWPILSELKKPERLMQVVLIVFILYYFIILGRSAVKFMRYMLPLYPGLAVLAAYGITTTFEYSIKRLVVRRKIITIVLGAMVLWMAMFMRIYSLPHTRIAASEWIYENIPSGSRIGVEHWDDRLPLPLTGFQSYQFVDLPLYEPDTPYKWSDMNGRLANIDYMIIASNRLYTPLGKLTDCENLRPGRCYKETAEYYDKLLTGKMGFAKVAEFTSYPGIKIGRFEFEYKDDDADESFTVYDHPKVIIFKKM